MFRLVYLLAATALFSCSSKATHEKVVDQATTAISSVDSSEKVPTFDADSAYHFVDQQVKFGPRVPNSAAHKACGAYLAQELERLGAKVFQQNMTVTAYDKTPLEAMNIIGSYNPEKEKRILLFAHWDSRPYADHDANATLHKTPIDGADDGASGVGALLEIARQLSIKSPEVGVDIIFFDAEDYGTPEFVDTYIPDTWCLGSQFWAKNPHVPNYKADFGILLDMVGAKDATFYKEFTSMRYAARYVDLVWNTARNLGYGRYFVNADGSAITDDHQYVISGRGIPCIDIIHTQPNGETGFGKHWHTSNDTMENIDRNTLKAVGQTVLEIIYKY